MTGNANETDRALEVAAGLADLEPGRVPLDIFNQIARLTVIPVVEVVPIYSGQGEPMIVLYRRPQNDQHTFQAQFLRRRISPADLTMHLIESLKAS